MKLELAPAAVLAAHGGAKGGDRPPSRGDAKEKPPAEAHPPPGAPQGRPRSGPRGAEAAGPGGGWTAVGARGRAQERPDKGAPQEPPGGSPAGREGAAAKHGDGGIRGGQSKRRMKRHQLYGKLFKNIGRAVDDMYFLCEVDCHSERIRKAVHFLRDSLNDFEDLARRVEEQKNFMREYHEGSKNHELKTPASVAWEVRRTKSSPKHAEMLSSFSERRGSYELLEDLPWDQEGNSEVESFIASDARVTVQVTGVPSSPPNGSGDVGPAGAAGAAGAAERGATAASKAPAAGESGGTPSPKRSWTDVLRGPRNLHAKLMSPDRQKPSPVELKKRADERQARASRLRAQKSSQLAKRLAKAEEGREAARASGRAKLERLTQKHEQKINRGRENREAHLYSISSKAKKSNEKVSGVIHSNFLEEQSKREALKQKMEEAEARKQEHLAAVIQKQKEAEAAIEEAQERKNRLEEERKRRLSEHLRQKAEIQEKKKRERQAAQEALQLAAEQQRVAAEQHAREQVEQAEAKKQRLAVKLKEAQKRKVAFIEQIKRRATDVTFERREPLNGGLSPSSPSRHAESPKPKALSLDENLIRRLRKKSKKYKQRILKAEYEETIDENDSRHYSQMQIRIGRAVKELRKQTERRNFKALRATLSELVHYFETGSSTSDLHTARTTGLLKFVAESATAVSCGWPVRIQSLALRLASCLMQGAQENRASILCSNVLLEVVPSLTTALDADENEGEEEAHLQEASGRDGKPAATGPPLELMLSIAVLSLSSSIERYNQVTRDTIGFMICSGIIHVISDHFSLFNSPHAGAPFPASVEKSLALLEVLTHPGNKEFGAQEAGPITDHLMSAMRDTSLVGLPSVMTAALLHASSPSSADINSANLPSNFIVVAESIMRVLNNCACHDLSLTQEIMTAPDLRVELVHLVSFLLTFCTSQWDVNPRQIKGLLNEALLLTGHFAVLHTANQGVLHWGKSPTILKKLCALPFPYFCDPALQAVLFPTFLAVSYSNASNSKVIGAEVDLGIVLRYLRQIVREAPAANGAAVSRFHLSRRFPRALFSDAVEWLEGHRD